MLGCSTLRFVHCFSFACLRMISSGSSSLRGSSEQTLWFQLPHSLPGLQLITKKLEMPVKLVFPRNLLGGIVLGANAVDYLMLGLGDMAIPGMLLALVLCFDHRKDRNMGNMGDPPDTSSKGHKYVWHALFGYAVGLVTALAAGILSQSAQPALLYLVPSTLGPVIFLSWIRKELHELWEGAGPSSNDTADSMEV